MVWKFSVFLLSALYLGTLWFARNNPDAFLWPGLASLLILVVGIRITTKKFVHALLPVLLFIGSVLFLPLIDSSTEAGIFMVLSAGVFYLGVLAGYRLGDYERDKTAKAMYNLLAFATLFCWFAAGYGWYLNIQMPVWMIMAIFVAIVFPVSYLLFHFDQLGTGRHQKILYSIFLSYLMAGVIWVQDFWPFGYLTTAVVALIIYYSGWDVIRSFFLNKLTLRRAMFSILFLAGAISLILLSTNWYPVV